MRNTPPHLLTDVVKLPIVSDQTLGWVIDTETSLELCALNHQFGVLLLELARGQKDERMMALALTEGTWHLFWIHFSLTLHISTQNFDPGPGSTTIFARTAWVSRHWDKQRNSISFIVVSTASTLQRIAFFTCSY